MEERPRPRIRRHHQAAILLLVAVIGGYALWMRGDRSAPSGQNPPAAALAPAGTLAPPATSPAVPPSTAAPSTTEPAEPKHYSDRRRFLAIQMADTRQEQLELPQDDGDLAAMLRAGKLVELPPLGEDYILYD